MTRGLSDEQIERLLYYAQVRESARTYAILVLLVTTACRVSSVTDATVAGLGHDSGHTVADLPVKGGDTERFILAPIAVDALERYLATRDDLTPNAPLFATSTGNPIDDRYIRRLLRRVAKAAGIPHADQLSPHGIRHSVATSLLNKHRPLQIVQGLLGHADPRTTLRYDADNESLDRRPAYDLGAALSEGIARDAAAYAPHPAADPRPK